ncbi:hypothetical protein [Chrysiogenes arsenatis]|uniref:hypothetical protein n=1 Tax=Chrysiogenes arsenatis TaxID=309797 RepID=UPI0004244E18|nr:hypothetical protein [Chrysiogenes arsenatis]
MKRKTLLQSTMVGVLSALLLSGCGGGGKGSGGTAPVGPIRTPAGVVISVDNATATLDTNDEFMQTFMDAADPQPGIATTITLQSNPVAASVAAVSTTNPFADIAANEISFTLARLVTHADGTKQ